MKETYTLAKFTPVISVGHDDNAITADWTGSFNWATTYGEEPSIEDHEPEGEPFSARLDARLDAIRALLKDNDTPLAELVRPLFA